VISRTTMVSLFLALLIPSGMSLWFSGHRDSCSRYLAGDRTRPPTQMVEMGSQMVEVPCEQWAPRQPMEVQLLCLAELLVVLVFVIHAAGDIREWMQVRRLRREAVR